MFKRMDGANRALEGTCSGDVVGGLLLWTGENLQALLFGKDKLSGFVLGGYKTKPLGINLTRGYCGGW
jgi:hypothetical protein